MNVLKYIITRSLPKTGQDAVFRTGDDGTYQAGWWKNKLFTSNKVRFIDNGDGTIIDRATGLMWTQLTKPIPVAWNAAIDYANNLNFAGYTDWRLPNVFELLSILNFAASPVTGYVEFFIDLRTEWYWTSTAYIDYNNYARYVDFSWGIESYEPKVTALFVLCCRTI